MKSSRIIVWVLVVVCVGVALTQVDFSAETEAKDNEAVQAEMQEKVVDKAYHTNDLKTFVAALKTAGMADSLNADSEITIFAPSDSAFTALPEGEYGQLMAEGNKDELTKILNYHIVKGYVTAEDLESGDPLITIMGDTIRVTSEDDELLVNGTPLVETDIEASNGIIHIIDRVLSPGKDNSTAQAAVRQ